MRKRIDCQAFWDAKYFPALDGLRAICVLLVIFNHIHVPYPRWIVGWIGVDVFFVLSGFLITTLLVRERETSGGVSLKSFYTRRFFRIIPVYLFAIALYVPALRLAHDVLRWAQFKNALPWLLGFLQEYRPANTGNVFGHAWTLGIEEKFYLLWPLILIGLYPFRRKLSVASLVVIAGGLLLLPHTFARSYGGLLIGAVLGVALSQSSNWPMPNLLRHVGNWPLYLGVIVTYGLAVINPQTVLLFSASMGLVIAALVLRSGKLRTVLSAPPLVFIGKRSYSIYLIHVLAINAVEKVLPSVSRPNWVSVVSLSYAVGIIGASVMYLAIERPCISFGRRLSALYSERRLPDSCPVRPVPVPEDAISLASTVPVSN